MNLPYFAADTLGVTLYAMREGLVANEVHEMPLGPWKVELPIDVTSDLMAGDEMGLWVTLAGTLQLYLIIREKESWLFVLDAAEMKRLHESHQLQTRVLKTRVLELKPAIKGVFVWRGDEWAVSLVKYDGLVMKG